MFLSFMLLDIIDIHDIFDTRSCVANFSFIWVLFSDTINEKLKEFLIARNPKHQHSATLDSYLIKPIQRILKYPLLLQQLCNLTDSDTDEHHHLSGNYSYLIKPIQRILKYPLLLQQLCNLTDSDTDEHHHLSGNYSYLIKPIQRILKYPLLLQQLCNLTDSDTDEHHHLSGNYRCFPFREYSNTHYFYNSYVISQTQTLMNIIIYWVIIDVSHSENTQIPTTSTTVM